MTPLDILLLPCVMKILQLWFYWSWILRMLQQFLDGVDGGVSQPKSKDLSLGDS